MILNDPFFLALSFFSMGFLSIVFFISFCLQRFFRLEIYKYYSFYTASILLFIITVYVKNTGDFPLKTTKRNVMQLMVDGIQMISSLLFCSFIYHALLIESIRFKKLQIYYRLFIWFTLLYIALIFIFPEFIRNSFVFFIISRILIIMISMVFYFEIGKNLKIVYFRYLFVAISFLFIAGFLGIWDSTVNASTSIYTGFQYLCLGYFLENACFVGAFIYKYHNTYKEKSEAEIAHQMQIIKTQTDIQQQTMNYIGREIHDNIGQKLTLASLYTQQLAYENKAPQINENIENISAIINQSLAELRELSKSLTDDAINSMRIAKLLQQECDKINELKKCSVDFNCAVPEIELNYQLKSVLLRICQEFIQNSIKHSQCKNISIEFYKSDSELTLSLSDDGIGFIIDKSMKNGIGLSNMKKRSEIIGGKYSLLSNPKNGTKLSISIPL